MFFNLRDVPGLKKKPSTSELLDWLKLLLAEDIPPEALRSTDQKVFIPPLHGALLKNEQDVHLFERVVFMARAGRLGADMESRFIEPVTLRGAHATLEPLAPEHREPIARGGCRRRALAALVHVGAVAGDDGRVARRGARHARAAGRDAVRRPRRARAATSSAARATSTSTRSNRRLEIGHTWYAKRAQRTAINTECKLLLLTHAFETLGCIAVEFRTHWFNHASRSAIARLGAKQDGVLRNHQLLPDGSRRDTVVFSIIDGEWPAVRSHLKFLLDRRRAATCGDTGSP